MSEHAKEAMFDDIEQTLLELIGDMLDDEEHVLRQAIAGVEDPVKREESELHINMAKAAMEVYKATVIDIKP